MDRLMGFKLGTVLSLKVKNDWLSIGGFNLQCIAIAIVQISLLTR